MFACFETETVDVSENASSEEAEDSYFWEGATKPEISKTSASEQESQVQKYI